MSSTLVTLVAAFHALAAPAHGAPAQSSGEHSGSFAEHIRLGDSPASVRVSAGPILLHAGIEQQWGGHTFSYLLEGERGVFWTAKLGPAGPILVGQAPVPGWDLETRVTTIAFDGLDPGHAPVRVDQPQILRTPDGTLHLFVGVQAAEGEDGYEHGDVRYLRSVRPEDVSAFEDRSERIPRGAFSTFHQNRKNVGLDRKGERVVLFVLSDFVPNRYLMNTPLVFIGEVKEGELTFREPVVIGPQIQFFYPQVAATDEGPVLLGSVHHEPSRHAELIHLDWDGEVLAHLKLPFPEVEAETWAYEMEPFDPLDWSRLLIVRSIIPAVGSVRWIEFWSYDTRTRELALERSIRNETAQELSITNAGQLWAQVGARPLFLSEPASSAIHAWEGDLCDREPLRLAALPGTRVSALGLPGIRSLFVPSVLQGSLPSRGRRAVAVDANLPGTPRGASGPCAWNLWWLERDLFGGAGDAVRFTLDSDFGSEAHWMNEYLRRCAGALVTMLDQPGIAPPTEIRVELRRDDEIGGIGGWASGEEVAIGFVAGAWPEEQARLWIVAHELVNLMVAHYADGGGFPSDWWSNGRSPFAEYVSCLVMRAVGHPEAADWRRADGAGQSDHDLYWQLDERYGFKLFARFLRLLREDHMDLGVLKPEWPLPSGRRSLYTAAYLSLAAGENVAALIRAANVGLEPPGWQEAHPDWPFTPYTIEDEAVAALLERRAALFGAEEGEGPELEARRAHYRRGE